MAVFQRELRLPSYRRGIHLITQEIQEAIRQSPVTNGILQVFIKHTSAGLTINENADPTVREDFEAYLDHLVAEDTPYFVHTYEGPDDMPAHIKSSLMGSSVSIPVKDGKLVLGTWQGVYLGEFRNFGGNRSLFLTIIGE
jgi:secondary thiamine-phosphate synthase enzyme